MTNGLQSCKFSQLARHLDAKIVNRGRDFDVQAIEIDSRRIVGNRKGVLFFAIPGAHFDGHDFAPSAVKRGAEGVIAERNIHLPPTTSFATVASARESLARASSFLYGHPSQALKIVAVTGTNGKTTTTWMVKSIIEANATPTAMIGTIEYQIGSRKLPAARTTPEASELHRILAEARQAGVSHVVLEASSQGLHQRRLDDVDIDVAVFTQLSHDHLDYHGDMNNYLEAKAILFDMLKRDAVAVLNADDPASERLRRTQARIVTYGIQTTKADFTAEEVREEVGGIFFTLKHKQGEYPVRLKLAGQYNVYNALAAAAAAHALNISTESIQKGLASLAQVPGRLQDITRDMDLPFSVFVDYAHTPDALAACLRAMRRIAASRLTVVMGCGGDRDKSKRPIMGKIATELADRVWITSDNPRTEDPLSIIDDILAGIENRHICEIEPDREKAIYGAISEAQPGDVVVVAGRGHESVQVIGNVHKPFEDARVARTALEKILAEHS